MLEDAITKLRTLDDDFYWDIGTSILGPHTCVIREKVTFPKRGRVAIRGIGTNFVEAIDMALKNHTARYENLKLLADEHRRLADARSK